MTLEQAKERALAEVKRGGTISAIVRLSMDLEALGLARPALQNALAAIDTEGGEDALRDWIESLRVLPEK